MKKLLLATTALALFVGGANAADMNVTPSYKAPPPVAQTPTSDWSGFYLGFHGGWGSGESALDTNTAVTGLVVAPALFTFSNPSPKGALWGGEVGYNWQYYNAVVGVEVDYSAASLTDSQSVAIPNTTVTANLATKVDALASGRARVGWAVVPSVLLYGTGGVAWGHGSATESLSQPAPAASISQTAFANQFGWVAGAGLEYMVLNHFLFRAEFLHYDFGDVSFAFPNAVAGLNTVFANSSSAKVQVNVARGGIGFKFGAN